MASETPVRIRDAALHLFPQHWFETVSIAEVCGAAGVSNGVFYRYYRTKGDLVRALLDEFLERFDAELAGITGASVEERLTNLFATVFAAGVNYAAGVSIFREGQYRFPEYEDRIREIYLRSCRTVFRRDVSEAEYLYAVSGLRFNSTRALYDGLPRRPEVIARFVLHGVFPGSPPPEVTVPRRFPQIDPDPPADSRERLIQSGMKLIGERGYHEIGIADIVRDSNLAVGTFYTYFASKEEFFSIIVEQIGRTTRRYLSMAAKTHGSRLEREASGTSSPTSTSTRSTTPSCARRSSSPSRGFAATTTPLRRATWRTCLASRPKSGGSWQTSSWASPITSGLMRCSTAGSPTSRDSSPSSRPSCPKEYPYEHRIHRTLRPRRSDQ